MASILDRFFEYDPMAGSCENNKEPLGSITGGEFPDQLLKDSDP
jgi:hypothetical protein